MTNFPTSVDTDWQDPDGSSVLNTSPDGRTHTDHHSDLNSVALSTEQQLVGPAFASVVAYDARAATILNDGEATTGWAGTNTTVSLDATRFSTGTHSIRFANANTGWSVNPNLTTKGYMNLTGDQVRDSRLQLAMDVRWDSTDFGESDTLLNLFHLVVADAVDLGGNTVVWRLPPVEEATWTTVTVPIIDLTKVRSFGLVSYAVDGDDTSKLNFNIDNVTLAAQTPFERALGTNPTGGVVVPPSYATAQGLLLLPSDVTMTDLRSDYIRVRGERDVRQYQIPLDGTTDVTEDIGAIFASLQNGDKLVFPKGYKFLLSSGTTISSLTNVEIDLGGAKFYTQQSVIDGALFRVRDCRYFKIGNGRLYGYAPNTKTGSTMTAFSGSPTFPGDGTVQLTSKGDAVVISTQNQGYTVDDEIPFAVTIKQSGAATNDVCFEIVDSDAPATSATLAATGAAAGGMEPGVYYFGVSYVDIDGRETTMGPRTSVTLATGDSVTLTNLPTASDIQYTGRKIFRTFNADMADDPRNYGLVAHIPDNTTTTLVDNHQSNSKAPANAEKITAAIGSAGNILAGDYNYFFSVVFSNGTESHTGSKMTSAVHVSVASRMNLTVPVTALSPISGTTVVARRIYRTLAGLPDSVGKSYYYVGTISDNTTTAFTDNLSDATISTGVHGPLGLPASADLPSHAEFTNYITPSASNTVQTFVWTPVQQRDHPHPILRKVSTATNTITITQSAVTTYAQYDAAAETSAGVSVTGSSKEIEIHDLFVTLMGEDAVFINSSEAEGVHAHHIVSYGNRRQGLAMNSGRNITFEDCEIHHPGRSGIDLEPYSGDNFASQITIRRVRIFNPKNSSIASAGNWHKIRQLLIEDVYAYGGLFGAGAAGGRVQNITNWWGQATIAGQNVHMSNCDVESLTLPVATKTGDFTWDWETGGNVVKNVRLLVNDIEDGGGNVFDGIYLVSGPVTGPGIVTDITPP